MPDRHDLREPGGRDWGPLGEPVRVAQARRYAKRRHQGTTGRDGVSAYFDHVHVVAELVAASGGSDALVCAAYLHDVVEDTPATIAEVSSRFGDDVAALVSYVTDRSTHPVTGKLVGWFEQRRSGVADLADAPDEIVLLKAADLCANIEELLRNFAHAGSDVWEQYPAGAGRQVGYYLTLGDAVLHRLDDRPLRDRLSRRLAALRDLIAAERIQPSFVEPPPR
jgi:(p)ppGpp synthase/HD superfamily hydrolase